MSTYLFISEVVFILKKEVELLTTESIGDAFVSTMFIAFLDGLDPAVGIVIVVFVRRVAMPVITRIAHLTLPLLVFILLLYTLFRKMSTVIHRTSHASS